MFGCGGSSEGPVTSVDGTGQSTPTGFANIRVSQQVRSQAVPASVDTVRVTGFQSAIINGVFDALGGGIPFPSQELPFAPTYTISNVPVAVDSIRIEYLDSGTVVGLVVVPVQLQAGQVLEINDPAFISKPSNVPSFELSLRPSGAFPYAAPEGELVHLYPGLNDAPPLRCIVPMLTDLETQIFESKFSPDDSIADVVPLSFQVSDFTLFQSSNPSAISVGNSGSFNSTFRSGTLSILAPGTATITATYFDIVRTITLNVVEPSGPFEVQPNPEMIDPLTIERFIANGRFLNSGGIPVERIVTTELIFRPSEKPEVAEWDLTPGREGFILRGSQPGRVILWAQHRDNPIWIPVPVINS